MVQIVRVDTQDRQQVKQFVEFPFLLYRNCRQWVPPLLSSAYKQLNRERHAFYRHSDADFFLARQGREITGRIAVLEPRKRNAYQGRKGAFFYLMEVVEDREVAAALFGAAFDWARQRRLEAISGPDGFLAGDALGALVKGFEYLPAMGITYNHAYYDALIQEAGFHKQTDYNSCYLPGSVELSERTFRVADKVRQRRGFEVISFRNKREMRAIAPRVIDAYNAAFSENREFIPLTGEDAQRIADRLIDMADPQLVKAVVKGQEIVGFLLGFPHVNRALQRCRGRLYPFGWAMLLNEARRTRTVNFNGAGILPQYQGLGVNAIMYTEILRTIRERGFEHIELVQVNEQNTKMMAELELLGADFYKAHRIYERGL